MIGSQIITITVVVLFVGWLAVALIRDELNRRRALRQPMIFDWTISGDRDEWR